MDKQQLAAILEKHKKWLAGDEDGERADLCDAKLIDIPRERWNP